MKENANRTAQDYFKYLQKAFELPNFGSWYDLELRDSVKTKIIENARKIRDMNLRFDLLD